MCKTQIFLSLLFFLVSIITFKDGKDTNRRYLIIAVLAILIAIFRDDTMADYLLYKEDFEGKQYYGNAEPFYYLIRYVSRLTQWPWFVASLIFATISIPLKFLYLKKMSPLFWGSVLLYLSLLYVVQDLIAIRSACAAAFLLPIVYYKQKKKYVSSVIFLLMAICFHYTAIIFGIILIFNENRSYKYIYILGIIVAYYLAISGYTFGRLLAVVDIGMLSKDFSHYQYGDEVNIFNLVQVVRTMMCLAAWYTIPINNKNVIFLKIYSLSIILFLLLSDLTSVAIRFQELLLLSEVLVIPSMMLSVFRGKLLLAKLAVISYATATLILITINSDGYWNL